MVETFYFSNKAKTQNLKYLFIFTFVVITWILQVSILNRFVYFDAAPNLLFLGAVFFGLVLGPLAGTIFGLIVSFFSCSIFYDHVFYFSYPLLGFISGLLIKNIFSDELLFYISLCFLLTFPYEFLNGWQYNFANHINISERYFMICFNSALLNLLLAPFFYFFVKFLIKRFKLKS